MLYELILIIEIEQRAKIIFLSVDDRGKTAGVRCVLAGPWGWNSGRKRGIAEL